MGAHKGRCFRDRRKTAARKRRQLELVAVREAARKKALLYYRSVRP